ncbi:mobile mystery protein B [Granulicella sp. dw_53]|uniref:mobile mystery protein B n=1 Tax=Granulicella sp. dw_53 TaxID=2719792 RepID=UPI001BD54902|nr:mobile mystery protein B [Granulicella sp. dw_53]
MTLFTIADGNTALSPEEQDDLIPDLTTKEELNEWERQNILEAYGWALNLRNLNRQDPFAEAYIRELHLRMFDQTWKWAGTYRITEKNIGIPHYQIREALAALLGDAHYWVEHQTFEPDELAIRFHHRLVSIHPFANGNGRHARLMADVVVKRLNRPIFTWGRADIVRVGDFRRVYIDALRAADKNDIQPLLSFSRS